MVFIINQRYTVSWSYFNRKDCELESKTKRKKEERNIVMKLIWVNREERRVEDKGTLKSRVRSIEYKGRERIHQFVFANSHPEWDTQRHYLGGERSEAGLVGRRGHIARRHCHLKACMWNKDLNQLCNRKQIMPTT